MCSPEINGKTKISGDHIGQCHELKGKAVKRKRGKNKKRHEEKAD